jgi:very-short-patch-repair endonuclease
VLDDLLFVQNGVLTRAQALRFLSPSAIKHRLTRGSWQSPHRSVYVTHNGSLTPLQRLWVASLGCGTGTRPAVLGGLSALEVLGFRGYGGSTVHVLLPAGHRAGNPPVWVLVHRTRHLPACDVHRVGRPPCTMPARSLVDAARWARSDDQAAALVLSGFQQRLVAGDELCLVLDRLPNTRRSKLIRQVASDAAGGSHSLAELRYLRASRAAGLPEPTRQAVRRDATGRRRYVDVLYEEYGVQVEIDGSQHLEVRAAWADMKRQNDLWTAGSRVLRFPAWLVRVRPDEVVAQVRAALIASGWKPYS